MEDRYHVCRWCRHYSDGKCLKDNVEVFVTVEDVEIEADKVEVYIKDPNNFYCKEWQ